ncbi:hypothetical protein COOONC_28312 [Cooperia oncophora]
MSDRSSAKGIRRIMAVTGEKARENRRYAMNVLSRLEAEIENPNRKNQVDSAPDEKTDWARIPYLINARCRELQKSIKKKRKAKKTVVAT